MGGRCGRVNKVESAVCRRLDCKKGGWDCTSKNILRIIHVLHVMVNSTLYTHLTKSNRKDSTLERDTSTF
jgi:hypothetical protein